MSTWLELEKVSTLAKVRIIFLLCKSGSKQVISTTQDKIINVVSVFKTAYCMHINVKRSLSRIELKSLILAQIERWRHALHMQVERQHGCLHLVASGGRVSNASEHVQERGITHRKMC